MPKPVTPTPMVLLCPQLLAPPNMLGAIYTLGVVETLWCLRCVEPSNVMLLPIPICAVRPTSLATVPDCADELADPLAVEDEFEPASTVVCPKAVALQRMSGISKRRFIVHLPSGGFPIGIARFWFLPESFGGYGGLFLRRLKIFEM